MSSVLHINYEASVGWALPILGALEATPSLAARHAHWRNIGLSDLAFAIETRFGTMHEAVRLLSESLRVLGEQLDADRDGVDEHLRRGAAYRFKDRGAVY